VAVVMKANEGESFDSLLKRFNRKVQQDGILSEVRRRGRYQKPLTRRARKDAASRRQATRAARANKK
jgi:small subunit ribosomal protein S21